jgi:hypothetical protein
MSEVTSFDEILSSTPAAAPVETEYAEPTEAEPVEQVEEELEAEPAPEPAPVEDKGDVVHQLKSELSALTKERERIRQKEAALDEERARLAESAKVPTEPAATDADLRANAEKVVAALFDNDPEAAVEKLMAVLTQRQQEPAVAPEKVAPIVQQILNEQRQVQDFEAAQAWFVQNNADLDSNPRLAEMVNNEFERNVQSGMTHMQAAQKATESVRAFVKELGGGDRQPAAPAAPRRSEADSARDKLNRGGFSEVRSAGRSEATKPFTGLTPMTSILGKSP